MGIIAWFRNRKLQKQKRNQTLQLTEIRTRLQKLNRQQPQMHPMIEPELGRLRELTRHLRKVKNEEDMKSWLSLYDMCAPVFNMLLNTSQSKTKAGKK